jgi:hypothetical protein
MTASPPHRGIEQPVGPSFKEFKEEPTARAELRITLESLEEPDNGRVGRVIDLFAVRRRRRKN